MLCIDDSDTIEGVQVYGDDEEFDKFYLLPEQPRFRIDEMGRPIFKFLKYRFPVDRPDGRKGGGFVAFDVEFTVPDDKLERVREQLQERVVAEARRRGINPVPSVKISSINYINGTAHLSIGDEDGVLVQRINQAGKPSLYGKNISTYSLELTPEGATLFEQALQGQGGFVSIQYDLYFQAKLPPIHVTARFHAFAFYRFFQDVDVEERFWSEDDYRETLRETMIESEAQDIEYEWGGLTDEKVKSEIRDWAQRALDDATERLMIEALPVESADEAMKLYKEEDIENITRDIQRYRVSDFTLEYTEGMTVEFNKAPQGLLPNITTLIDKAGNPIVWEDYAQEVDLDDPFFRQLNISVFVNADFDELPIHSVEVKLNYNGRPMALEGEGVDGEYRFIGPNDVAHFASFVEADNWNYSYSYQVNYEGASGRFQSDDVETNESVLTVNVDDMGILLVDIAPGDLNFAQVRQAQLIMRYEDATNSVAPIEQQFILDEANRTHRFQEVIFARQAQPYQYRIKYFMQDGKEYEMDWVEGDAQRLYINDPFSSTKKIGVRAAGNLDNEIETIFVDLTYRDEANNYSQSISIALNKRLPFFDWEFPVIDENAGVVTYIGNIVYQDGTIEEIPETVTTSSTPIIGETVEDRLSILILADLLDFSEVKLARLALSYWDEANGILERTDFVFGGRRPTEQTWNLKLKDKTQVNYEWEATYFMADGSRQTAGPNTSDDLTLILELPM